MKACWVLFLISFCLSQSSLAGNTSSKSRRSRTLPRSGQKIDTQELNSETDTNQSVLSPINPNSESFSEPTSSRNGDQNLIQTLNREDLSAEHKFYISSQGQMIMQEENYTGAIKTYLANENRAVVKHLFDGSFDSVLEVGCGYAIKASMFTQLGYQYSGIDINPNFVTKANESMKYNSLEKSAKASELSIFDLNRTNNPVKSAKKTLILFPFNLFGNLPNQEEIIETCIRMNYEIFISSYTTDLTAFNERHAYYSNCGYSPLRYVDDGRQVKFSSELGLDTSAYSENYYKDLLQPFVDRNEIEYKISKFDAIGFSIIIKKLNRGN
jgi:SAM-dependent methyltransferase